MVQRINLLNGVCIYECPDLDSFNCNVGLVSQEIHCVGTYHMLGRGRVEVNGRHFALEHGFDEQCQQGSITNIFLECSKVTSYATPSQVMVRPVHVDLFRKEAEKSVNEIVSSPNGKSSAPGSLRRFNHRSIRKCSVMQQREQTERQFCTEGNFEDSSDLSGSCKFSCSVSRLAASRH